MPVFFRSTTLKAMRFPASGVPFAVDVVLCPFAYSLTCGGLFSFVKALSAIHGLIISAITAYHHSLPFRCLFICGYTPLTIFGAFCLIINTTDNARIITTFWTANWSATSKALIDQLRSAFVTEFTHPCSFGFAWPVQCGQG